MEALVLGAVALAAAAVWELAGARGEAGSERLRRMVAIRDRPGANHSALARLAGDASSRLLRAGLDERVPTAALVAAKLTSALLSLPPAALAAPVLPGRLGAIVVVGVPVAAFLAPDLLVERAAASRRGRIAAALPDALDLMATGAATGQGVGRLIEEATGSSSGPLREELGRAFAAIECGTSKEEALGAMVERARGSELAVVATALERSRRHGSPLSRTLHEQAASLRSEQRRRITERAARAAPKMQLVVALLLVPSVLLAVAAAIVANSGSLLPTF